MTNYIANGTDLTAVANAIRSKGGTSAMLTFPSAFVSAINDLGGDYVIIETNDSSITVDNYETYVITNLPTTLDITLEAPTSGDDFIAGAIFRAGTSFSLTENAPNNWLIWYEDSPTWTAGKVYEIVYRALWLAVSVAETDVSGGTVEVDSLTFQGVNSSVGDYVYTYDGSAWKDADSNTVTLATLGITLTGTAVSGDTITISNLKCISAKYAEVSA